VSLDLSSLILVVPDTDRIRYNLNLQRASFAKYLIVDSNGHRSVQNLGRFDSHTGLGKIR